MSLEDLLGAHTITVKGPNPVKDSSGGLTNPSRPTLFSAVPGYAKCLGSKQLLEWGGFVIEADHMLFTQQVGIINGCLVLTDDGRTLRVTGQGRVQNMGSIAGFFKMPCVSIGVGQ